MKLKKKDENILPYRKSSCIFASKMRQKKLFSCMLGGLLALCGCNPKSMPDSDLIGLRYVSSSTMARPEFEGSVKMDSTGVFVLKAMKENYGPMFETQITTDDMKHFRQIIEDEKMYKYKDSYRPRMQVMDGWGWTFWAKFADGSVIESHGSNARPDGNGLGKVHGYMERLIQDGKQIEFPEE